MLLKTNSMKNVKTAVISMGLWAALAGASVAQPAGDVLRGLPKGAEVSLPNLPYGNLSNLTAEQIEEAKRSAAGMVDNILKTYDEAPKEEAVKAASEQRRRADDIADAVIAAERDKVMKFLGIDPASDSTLYYFVSWSMPLEMLRSYAVEAMWAGGTLVIKGVPPGKELGSFIVDDLRKLVYGKGAAANISIDPRLFDAYDIKTVPTIVFTTVRDNMQCQGINPVPFEVEGKTYTYDTCPPIDPSKYWKITGAVTTNYALQTFIDDGAKQAERHLSALSRGWAGQPAPAKGQVPFTGEWKDVLSPAEQAAAQEAARAMMPKASAP